MSQLRKNAFYNVSYQVIRIIFPIITFPYVSRILGPVGIGKVSYAQTFADYFITFSLLGLPGYAVREISKSRLYEGALEKTSSEILSLSCILTFIAYVLYCLVVFIFPNITAEPILHWIFSFTILFNWARIDWFFEGIEDFKYITIRNLLIRVVSLGLIFIFIKEKKDYIFYGLIWVLNIVITSVWNLLYGYRTVKFKYTTLSLKKHLKNCLPTTFLTFSLFIYSTIDTIMLGIMISDDKYSVGIYNTAGRIIRIIMSIIAGITAGLIPRLSYIIESGDMQRVKKMIDKSIDFILFISIPSSIGIYLLSNDIINLFAGKKFIESINTLRILSFELIFLGIDSIISPLLYSLGKEKKMIKIGLMGISLAIITNIIFIPLYKYNGAALATIITRFSISLYLIIIIYNKIITKVELKNYIMIIILNSIFILSILVFISLLKDIPSIYRIIYLTLISIIIYAIIARMLKIQSYFLIEDIIKNILRKIAIKIRK